MVKNPFSKIFGAILKRRREIMGKTLDEVANDIEITSSYYRLVESGTNNLHVSKSLKIAKAFYGEFNLDAICKFMMVIAQTESNAKSCQSEAKKSKKDKDAAYIDGITDAWKELSEFDDKLGILNKNIVDAKMLSFISDEDKLDSILYTLGIIEIFTDFLKDYDLFGKTANEVQNEYMLEFLNDIPTIYFDFLSETKANLMKLPVRIGLGLWQWELRNKMNLESFICFTNNIESVVSGKNLERYTYNYLWEKQFRKSRFIILSDKNANAIKQDFKNLLLDSLSKESDVRLKDFEYGINKINFKSVNNNSEHYLTALNKELIGNDYDNSSHQKEYTAFWIFTLKNKNSVGFLAKIVNTGSEENIDYKITEGISLNYRETIQKLELFNKLWEKI